MIGRLVLAALIAGMAAGLIMAGIQHVRLTPIIIAAEVFEQTAAAAPAAATHDHAAGTPAHDHAAMQAGETAPAGHVHDATAWAPADGFERTMSTTIASILAGAGFAILLAGISLLVGIPITAANGLMWGLCGFLAVTVAPGAGLAPELPGMPAADLFQRQVWWVATILATGVGLYLIVTQRKIQWVALAIALIALPHIIGAPQPLSHDTAVPAGLAASFASNTVAAAAVFWSLIGLFLGLVMEKFGKEVHAT